MPFLTDKKRGLIRLKVTFLNLMKYMLLHPIDLLHKDHISTSEYSWKCLLNLLLSFIGYIS